MYTYQLLCLGYELTQKEDNFLLPLCSRDQFWTNH